MKLIKNYKEVNLYSLVPRDFHKDEEFMQSVEMGAEKVLKPLHDNIIYEGESTLDKKFVQELEGMGWMKECKFHLVHSKLKSKQKNILDNLINTLKKKAIIVPELVSDCGLPILAIDTETTSLITDFKIYGGEINTEVTLVGIPLAVNEYEGYYIPVNHNETDKVKNFDKDIIQYFLQRLSDEFFLILFNANYDFNVLHLEGIRIHYQQYADIMVIGSALGFDTMIGSVEGFGFSLGLKNLSNYFLNRKALEITEVLGSKQHIVFSRLPAKYATSYAVPDAINTFYLFKHLVLDETDEDYNPYMFNTSILTLNHKVLFQSSSMFKSGLPLNNLENLENNVKTILNRLEVLEQTYSKIRDSEKYPIGTPEKVNSFLASKIINEILLESIQSTISLDLLDKKHKHYTKVQGFLSVIADDFGVIIKRDENKSRGVFLKFETRKVGYGKSAKGVPVLELTKSAVKTDYWKKMLHPQTLKELLTISELVDEYRGLILERGRIGKMYRYAVSDDRGYSTARVDLRIFGTDTKRYSNSGGTGNDRFTFTGTNLNILNYTSGNSLCGLNAQGLPATPYKFLYDTDDERNKIKKIINIKDKKFNTWLKAKKSKLKKALSLALKTKLNQKK